MFLTGLPEMCWTPPKRANSRVLEADTPFRTDCGWLSSLWGLTGGLWSPTSPGSVNIAPCKPCAPHPLVFCLPYKPAASSVCSPLELRQHWPPGALGFAGCQRASGAASEVQHL